MAIKAQQYLDAAGLEDFVMREIECNGIKSEFKFLRLPYLEVAKIEAHMLDGKSNFSPEGSAEIRPRLIAACVRDVDSETGNEVAFSFEEVSNWKNTAFIKALGEVADEVNGRSKDKAAAEARKNS